MRRGTPRLLVIRHAKAGYPAGVADHDRPLTDRGEQDARLLGEWLVRERFVPDLVLCSSSVRTRATWAHLAPVLPDDVTVQTERSLYNADAETILDLVRVHGGEQHTVAVIGHEPGASTFAQLLTDPETADPDELASLQESFPTAGVAVLRARTSWTDLAPGTATLTRVVAPRGALVPPG